MRFEKLTTKLQEALGEAQSAALGHDHQYIEPQHLLLALLDDEGIAGLVAKAGGNPNALKKRFADEVSRMPKVEGTPGEVHLSRELTQLLNAGNYSELETFEFKIPLNIPYPIQNRGFDRVHGAFEFDGEFYELVQQKLERDTLYVVCIKNASESRLGNSVPKGCDESGPGCVCPDEMPANTINAASLGNSRPLKARGIAWFF